MHIAESVPTGCADRRWVGACTSALRTTRSKSGPAGTCEDRLHYIFAAIPKPVTGLRAPTERKTGVKRADVITARLVQDERGWLRLAG
jgi:hypothetical protein